MEEQRIMIVDDQPLFAEGLKHVVEGESGGAFKVVGVASNGKQAIEMAKNLAPDVILMDVRMPVMDGVDATERIRADRSTAKIMILTTFDDDDLVLDALRAGANGYVLKNIEPRDLISAIDAVRTGALLVSQSVGFRLADKPRNSKDQAQSSVSAILSEVPVLTIREAEVLEQALRAKRNYEIAQSLFISEKTVRNHISAIYEKLGIHNRLQLMSLWWRSRSAEDVGKAARD